MIKIIIGLITVVFIVLVGYMFTQSKEKIKHKVAKKVEKLVLKSDEVIETKISQLKIKEHLSTKIEKKDVMDKVLTTSKSVEVSVAIELFEKIGADFTRESIENTDVSDEEKERMRDDLAYAKSLNPDIFESHSDEEILTMMREDLKNSHIQ